jgi:hypothetical protein
MNVICLDIDRHADAADGFVGVQQLGELPPTLAETSKSGAGRHLFYSTDHEWDEETGFGRYNDAIGLAPGVDMRAVGCVYHHTTQRWNGRGIVPLPKELELALDLKAHRKLMHAAAVASAAAASPDDVEALIMHDSLLKDLNRVIPTGKRNNTLFAVGSDMKKADYPDWEKEIERRGAEVHLDRDEVDKIISNINSYS